MSTCCDINIDRKPFLHFSAHSLLSGFPLVVMSLHDQKVQVADDGFELHCCALADIPRC